MAEELMKGEVWHKRKDALKRDKSPVLTYPVMVEVKHDEIRVHVKIVHNVLDHKRIVGNPDVWVEFLSYAGNPLHNLERFELAFLNIYERTGFTEFDMGFEVNGNFDQSYKWVRSSKGLKPELVDLPVKWYIFGLPGVGGDLAAQHRARLALATKFVDYTGLNVGVPEMFWAFDEDAVNDIYNRFREQGYEGAMVKQPTHLYERKRTDGWLKMKPENDADGIIMELHEAIAGVDQPELGISKGDRLGRIGSVTLLLEDNSNASPHGIPHELGRDMFSNPEKYIEQWVEFKYMERDRQGGYRHPTFHRLREAK